MQSETARLPPHNRNAERALLGAILRDPQIMPATVMLIRADDFYVLAHQEIFKAAAALGDRGKEIDVLTIAESLIKANRMDEVGHYYLGDLFDAAPTIGAYVQYAAIIRDDAIKRRLIYATSEITTQAFRPDVEASALLDQAERQILDIAELGITGDSVTFVEALKEEWTRLDERRKNPSAGGVPTGFFDLDQILHNLRDSEFSVIASRPSVGKTQFALTIAAHASADEGMPVLFIGLEQSRLELVERLLVMRAMVDSHKVRSNQLTPDEIERMMNAGSELSKTPIVFDDLPGQNMLRISANARRMKKRYGIKLMIVDYLQLIQPDDTRQPRHEQVGTISRRLKLLARELGIPVLALAQLNRESESGGGSVPKLSQLGASDNIGQDADCVMLLHRQQEDSPSSRNCLVDVIVEKNRNGQRGKATLLYEKPYMRFQNYQCEMKHPGSA